MLSVARRLLRVKYPWDHKWLVGGKLSYYLLVTFQFTIPTGCWLCQWYVPTYHMVSIPAILDSAGDLVEYFSVRGDSRSCGHKSSTQSKQAKIFARRFSRYIYILYAWKHEYPAGCFCIRKKNPCPSRLLVQASEAYSIPGSSSTYMCLNSSSSRIILELLRSKRDATKPWKGGPSKGG